MCVQVRAHIWVWVIAPAFTFAFACVHVRVRMQVQACLFVKRGAHVHLHVVYACVCSHALWNKLAAFAGMSSWLFTFTLSTCGSRACSL